SAELIGNATLSGSLSYIKDLSVVFNNTTSKGDIFKFANSHEYNKHLNITLNNPYGYTLSYSLTVSNKAAAFSLYNTQINIDVSSIIFDSHGSAVVVSHYEIAMNLVVFVY
ncbi:MAG: hypothetical protein QW812_05760, partial [Thermoplasmataceae archaeon]